MPDGRAGWDEMAALHDASRALPGGGEEAPVPLGEFADSASLRQRLREARERKWWTWRSRTAEAMAAAVEAVERDLLAEGADLDAPFPEPVGVRLLLGRLP